MFLWIDDVRTPPCDKWLHVRSVNQAKAAIRAYDRNMWDEHLIIDLDHDAGDYVNDGGDYIEILNWLEESRLPDSTYTFYLHTQNPVGRENMERIIRKNGWRLVK